MWEIYTYGGGDFLRVVFNGIAAIFGNDDYVVAVKIAALLGLLGIMVSTAFTGRLINFAWLLGICFIWFIAVVPKVNLIVTDRVVPAYSSVVGNVPFGLAFTASLTSKVGDWFARTFETVFSLPNQVKYTGNGLLMAQALVEEGTRFEITTPRIAENFSEFWKSCVFYDLAIGLYSWNDLAQAPDVNAFLRTRTSITRFFTYTDGAGSKSLLECRAGLNDQMQTDLAVEVAAATNIYGVRAFPDEASQAAAVMRFSGSLPIAYQHLTGLSSTAGQIVAQNALANSLKRGVMNFASSSDATAAAQEFAVARAEAERKVTFGTLGQLAKKMLPMLKNIFEAIIYAIFPLVLLLMMLPVAPKVAAGYAKALFWVGMWAPLYAVLHFVMTYYGANAGQAAVQQMGGAGLSIMTNTGLGHVMQDQAAIAGYLSLSIPMMAWMLISQSGAMMASLAGRMMQSYDKPTEKAADEASSGNMKLGVSGFDNVTAHQANMSPSSSMGGTSQYDSSHGMTVMTSAAGVSVKQDMSNAALSADLAQSVQARATDAYSSAVQKANESSVGLTSSTTAAMQAAAEVGNRALREQSGATTEAKQSTAEYQESVRELQKYTQDWAQKNGYSSADSASATGAFDTTIGTPGEGILGSGVSFKGRAEVSTSELEQHTSEASQRLAEDKEFQRLVNQVGSASHKVESSFRLSGSTSFGDTTSASTAQMQQAQEQHRVALAAVEQASSTLERSKAMAANGGQVLTDAVIASYPSIGAAKDDLTKARLGDRDAAERFAERAWAFTNDRLGDGPADNLKGQLLRDYRSELGEVRAANNAGVSGASAAWMGHVRGKAGVSQSDAETAANDARVEARSAMEAPESAVPQSGANATITAGREEVDDKGTDIKNRHSLSVKANETLPGALNAANEGRHERELEWAESQAKKYRDSQQPKDGEQ